MLKVVRRAGWGALDPDFNAPAEHGLFDAEKNPDGWLVYSDPLADALNTVVIHHSALPLADGPREIQWLHMHTKGFADVGYHFLIDQAGRIFEGRSLNTRGAHTGGANTGTVGVVLLGNFEAVEPSGTQLESLRRLVAFLKDQCTLTHLAGHRDFQPEETVCPGAYLEPLLPGMAGDLGLAFGTGGYTPPPWTGSGA